MINALNRRHASDHEGDSQLAPWTKSYELAARMQLSAPEALDLSNEPCSVLGRYGLDHGESCFATQINPLEDIDAF